MKNLLNIYLCMHLSILSVAVEAGQMSKPFLAEEPYRKTKQKVDLSSIKTQSALLVVKSAINPAMRFIVAISFVELPPYASEKLLTDHGRLVLRRPPMRNKFKRYSVATMRNWKTCGDKQVSFEAVFSDLLQKNFWHEHFLFIETPDGWRFDGHKEVDCTAKHSPSAGSSGPRTFRTDTLQYFFPL